MRRKRHGRGNETRDTVSRVVGSPNQCAWLRRALLPTAQTGLPVLKSAKGATDLHVICVSGFNSRYVE